MIAYLVARRVWLLLLLVAIIVNSLESADSEQERAEMASQENKLVLEEPLLQFGGELFKQVKTDEDNVIFSPLSIHGALNMVLLGIKNQSEAEKELLEVLGYSQWNQPTERVYEYYAGIINHFKMMTAENKKYQEQHDPQEHRWTKPLPILDMWMTALTKGPQKPLPEYLSKLEKYYNSTAHQIEENRNSSENEKLLKSINSWAKDAGFKNDLLNQDSLEEEFSVLLMSAIRVESHWLKEFYEYEVDDAFYNYGKKDQLVKRKKILKSSNLEGHLVEFTKNEERALHSQYSKTKYPEIYNELADLEFKAIDIPLKGDISMTIIEPFDPAEGKGLVELETALLTSDSSQNHYKLKKVLDILDSQEARVKFDSIEMPPFNFETNLKLKDHLKNMGLQRIFTQGMAEITGMSDGEQFISDAKHQAVIEVNKDGLKAAGITFIRAVPKSLRIVKYPIYITIKNPFMFLIRYNKLSLFKGHLVHL